MEHFGISAITLLTSR